MAITNGENEDPNLLLDEKEFNCLDLLKTSNLILTLLSLDGDLVFISPNVISLIGLKQTEMLGMSIFDFVHPCDHEELKNALKQINEDKNSINSKLDCSTSINQIHLDKNDNLFKENKYVSFMVRIKCTLNNKSKCVPLKSANYKVSFSLFINNIILHSNSISYIELDYLISSLI